MREQRESTGTYTQNTRNDNNKKTIEIQQTKRAFAEDETTKGKNIDHKKNTKNGERGHKATCCRKLEKNK